MCLERGGADPVAVYTPDLPAFRGIERASAEHGSGDRVQLDGAFDFVDAVEVRYQFSDQ